MIGSQVTPLPVILDDRVRTVERDLQSIAAHAGAGERYRLQITPGTGVFGPQLSVGGVVLQKVDASLPLVTAGATGMRTPRALALRVSSRRVAGRARVTITTRLRTRPCTGTVTFTITAAGRRTRSTASVPGVLRYPQDRQGERAARHPHPRRRAVQRQQHAAATVGEDRLAPRAVALSGAGA